jgi:hypothetical protein
MLGGLVITAAGAGVNMSSKHQAALADPPIRLELNMPAYRLHVYENGVRTKTFKVSVGMPQFQTPPGNYKISNVIWNPWWHPPKSEWASGRKAEAPGPLNPMGRIKLNFGPLLYIHGNDDWQALGDPLSHGCVRMMNHDLKELTELIQSYTTPHVSKDVLDKLADTPSQTKQFNFKFAVPFEVQYKVAAVENGFLYFYPDMYRKVTPAQRTAQAKAALAEHGITLAEVDRARLNELMERGRKTKVMISLDELRSTTVTADESSHRSGSTRSHAGVGTGGQ